MVCDTGSVKLGEFSDTARGGVGGNLGDGMTESCSTRHTTFLLVAPSEKLLGLGSWRPWERQRAGGSCVGQRSI